MTLSLLGWLGQAFGGVCTIVGRRYSFAVDRSLLHALLGIADRPALESHPKVGASWEGFVIEELLARLEQPQAYYWRTQAGAELDLLLFLRSRRIGIEIKRADVPTITPSMLSALADLKLSRLLVIYPGATRYALSERIEVLPLVDAIVTLSKLS